jgi:hypothetical protein
MTRFLDSYMAPNSRLSDNAFIDLVFHELTHTWVSENLGKSKLLEKYKSEERVVKNHLHLLAVQNFIYVKLGRADLVELLARKNRIIGGDYLRAWEIVQIEGYQAFMDELPVK